MLLRSSLYSYSACSAESRIILYNNVSILRLPDIPPDANITYELELLDVQPPLNFETIAEEELLKLV